MRFALTFPAAAVLLASAAAHAHIRLDSPKGRYNNDQQQATKQKDGPCGVPGDSRTTDPSLITTFAPGETITVEWTETINHSGHFRIAFVEEGQDFPDPTFEAGEPGGAILADGIPDEKSMNNSKHSFEVTLPNVTCEACTLQLIQVMKESPNDPFYFQCADIVIEGEPAGGTGGAGGGAAGMGGNGGGAAGMAESGGGGSSGAGPMGGSAGSSGNGGAAPSGGAGDGGNGGSAPMGSGGTAPQGGIGGTAPMGASGTPSGGGGGISGMPPNGGTAGTPSTSSGGAAGTPAASSGGSSGTAAESTPEPAEGGCALSAPGKRSGAWLLAVGVLTSWLVRRRARRTGF